jgi:hypothetical protein
MCIIYLVFFFSFFLFKKKCVSVVTVLSLLLSNWASCPIKQRVFASKDKMFEMTIVVLKASLAS